MKEKCGEKGRRGEERRDEVEMSRGDISDDHTCMIRRRTCIWEVICIHKE